ncbi:hypothetical protein [Roseiflexus sp.]|uniref:hypothetical protein n=1 Tax=Roseiflexus sp. TaxID=2562120 RepID=UPI00398A632C
MERTLPNGTRDCRSAYLQLASMAQRLGLSTLAAFIVGVVNPLFCVLHCSIIDATAHQYTLSGSVRFVCHLSSISHASTAEQEHVPGQHSTAPRAVYDGVLMLLALCAIFVLFTTRLALPDGLCWNSQSPAPPLPPPKSKS